MTRSQEIALRCAASLPKNLLWGRHGALKHALEYCRSDETRRLLRGATDRTGNNRVPPLNKSSHKVPEFAIRGEQFALKVAEILSRITGEETDVVRLCDGYHAVNRWTTGGKEVKA